MPGAEAIAKLDVHLKEPTLVYPAEPTQKHVYFLNNLDQNIAVTMRTVYFFNAQEDKKNDDPVAIIRKSLSKLLVHFYPMAGRLGISADDKLHVECEEQGVVFVEATADHFIAELGELSKPAPFMTQLVYDTPNARNILEIPPLLVQVTKFKCGGFVVGVNNNHCMLDGVSANEFVLAWGELARGLDISNLPHIDRSLLRHRSPPVVEFPHREFDEIEDLSSKQDLLFGESLVYNSFILDPEEVESIKRKITDEGIVDKVSSFEALTALTWRARTATLDMPADQKSRLMFAVDGRTKFDPPLPKHYMGNGIVLTSSVATAAELLEKPLSFAVKLVQEAIAKITDKYMKSAIDFFEVTRARPALVATLLITTWLRLPFHTVDFGWGQPLRMSPASLPGKEVVLFTSCGKDRKSVNILLGLPSLAAMEKFEQCLCGRKED